MHCEVNGESTPVQWISYRELGFGESVEVPLYPYVLNYGITEIRDLIAADANDFVRDMKADYEQTGDSSPRFLHDLGYPMIDILVQHERAFCETIRIFLYSELFRRSFPAAPPYRDMRWIINSVEMIRCQGGVIEVLGQAFRKVEIASVP